MTSNFSRGSFDPWRDFSAALMQEGRVATDADPDIKSAYRARDMWQVIDQVTTFELGGASNTVKCRTMLTSGAIIIAWLAKGVHELASPSLEKILDDGVIRAQPPWSDATEATGDPPMGIWPMPLDEAGRRENARRAGRDMDPAAAAAMMRR